MANFHVRRASQMSFCFALQRFGDEFRWDKIILVIDRDFRADEIVLWRFAHGRNSAPCHNGNCFGARFALAATLTVEFKIYGPISPRISLYRPEGYIALIRLRPSAQPLLLHLRRRLSSVPLKVWAFASAFAAA